MATLLALIRSPLRKPPANAQAKHRGHLAPPRWAARPAHSTVHNHQSVCTSAQALRRRLSEAKPPYRFAEPDILVARKLCMPAQAFRSSCGARWPLCFACSTLILHTSVPLRAFKPDGLDSCNPEVSSDRERSPGNPALPSLSLITNPIEVPSKRSTLSARVGFATPVTGPRWGPLLESTNAHLFPGEAAVRPLLGCMTEPRWGPGIPWA